MVRAQAGSSVDGHLFAEAAGKLIGTLSQVGAVLEQHLRQLNITLTAVLDEVAQDWDGEEANLRVGPIKKPGAVQGVTLRQAASSAGPAMPAPEAPHVEETPIILHEEAQAIAPVAEESSSALASADPIS